MEKKFTMIALSILFVITAVFAAGEQESAKQEVTMWFWGAAPEYREVLDEALVQPYNNSQDQYELVVSYDNAVDNNVATALAAGGGNAPDIIYGSGPAFVSQYAQSNKLANLTPYAEKYNWEDKILGPIYDAGKVNGNLYSLPGGTVTMGIFYNKKVLDDLRSKDSSLPKSDPKTLKEIEMFMDAALAHGYYASVTGNKGWKPVNENYATIFLNAFAGPHNVFDALNGNKSWEDEAFVKAIEKSAEWYQNGYLGGKMQNGKLVVDYTNLNFDESCQLLSAGKAAFFVGPSLAFQFMNPYFKGDKSKELGFTVFPMGNEEASQSYVLGTVNSFSIWEGSDKKDEAAKIIDMMMSEKFGEALANVWPGYWALPLKEFNPNTDGFPALSKEFVKAIQNMYSATNEGNFGIHISTFSPPLTQAMLIDIDRVWLNDLDASSYLKLVQKNFDKDLNKGSIPNIPEPRK